MEITSGDSLGCPIGLELFTDPVIGADGHTYERKNIVTWLQTHGTSPLTREPMSCSSLRPNRLVRRMVDEFIVASKEKEYQFHLDVDVRKCEERSSSTSSGKIIYNAEWIRERGPPIILLEIEGIRACREASFYAQLSCHPHIVRTFGLLHRQSKSVTLVQERSPYGDLSHKLCEKIFRPSADVLLEIFVQIIDALLWLLDHGIVHGNVVCRNVLIFRMDPTKPKNNLVKLTHFGLTKGSLLFSAFDSVNTTILAVKPIRHCAPEILKNKNISQSYTEKADVYSLGMLMWEAHSQGELPFSSIESDVEVKRARRSGELLEKPQSCSPELWSLMNTCWEIDPDARPTLKELKHNLMTLISCSSNQSDTSDLPTASNKDRLRRSKKARQNVSDEYPENISHRAQGSSSILMQNAYTSDDASAVLTSVPCMYCQVQCSIDELDMHEEICCPYDITMEFTGNPLVRSGSSRTTPTVGQQEERNDHDATSSTNRQTNSNNAPTSSQHEQDDEANADDAIQNQLYEMISEDLDKFVFTTIPEGIDYIQCRITRAKGDIYWLHAERPYDGKKLFVLVGRKRRWNISSNYTITTDAINLMNDTQGMCGLQAKSIFGTEFVVYDQYSQNQSHRANQNISGELAAVLYETNILGFKGPRNMKIILPRIRRNNERVEIKPMNDSDGLVERWKRHEMRDLLECCNKPPVWNEETSSYVLNFNNRVRDASVKNFQLVHSENPDYIFLQFGRISKDEFSCDYRYPLCAVQAFGIALSSFDKKLACE